MGFGGAEKHTLQLFNGLARFGFPTALAYLKREEHLLHEVDRASGTVWCAEFRMGWDFTGLTRLADWVRAINPGVIVCVNTYPLFYSQVARWLTGHRCRIIEIFHTTKPALLEQIKMSLVYAPFFNRCDCIVYVSAVQRAYWEGRGLRKELGVVIHNGVDTEYFDDSFTWDEKRGVRERFGFKRDDFVIGICAALRPEKKHEDLIEAVARLKSEGVPAHCLVIGDGPCRAAIESTIFRFGLENEVVITGFQTDVRPFLAACDCMTIVSTQVETFSLAALEAMAMSKPVVMSAVGGATEQVRNGDNGYLFPAGDVEALVAALRRLTNHKNCEKLGRAARRITEQEYALHKMINKYAALFGHNLGTDGVA
nr:glycosyltransferase [Rhabdochromatium marinum]